MRFLGNSEAKTDAKGRVFLPAIFRKQLQVAAEDCLTLDSNGRFLIPKRYLKLAHINQEVRIIGMDDTIEIWSKELVEKPFMDPEDFTRELEAIMGSPADSI